MCLPCTCLLGCRLLRLATPFLSQWSSFSSSNYNHLPTSTTYFILRHVNILVSSLIIWALRISHIKPDTSLLIHPRPTVELIHSESSSHNKRVIIENDCGSATAHHLCLDDQGIKHSSDARKDSVDEFRWTHALMRDTFNECIPNFVHTYLALLPVKQ